MRFKNIVMYAMVWVCLLAVPVQALEFAASGGPGTVGKSAFPQVVKDHCERVGP